MQMGIQLHKQVLSSILLLTLLHLPTLSYAQHPRVTNEGQHPLRHKAKKIRTDTSGWSNVLSDTDINVQIALDSVNALGGGIITSCDTAADDFCFSYSSSTNVLSLYVNGTRQWQWPENATTSFVLLENGDYLLLENGDNVVLESF